MTGVLINGEIRTQRHTWREDDVKRQGEAPICKGRSEAWRAPPLTAGKEPAC